MAGKRDLSCAARSAELPDGEHDANRLIASVSTAEAMRVGAHSSADPSGLTVT